MLARINPRLKLGLSEGQLFLPVIGHEELWVWRIHGTYPTTPAPCSQAGGLASGFLTKPCGIGLVGG